MCDHHRRNFLKAGSASLLLATGWSEVIAARRQVFRLEGDAWINDRPADFGSLIRPGDLVRTGENSLIVFSVARDVFMLRSNTRLQLEGEQGILDVLRLLGGGLLSVFEKGRRRTVHTPVATAGIRGTGLYLEAQPDELYFCNCYGEIELQGMNGGRELTRSVYHNARTVRRDTAGATAIHEDVFRSHNNWELEFLESQVGRSPGFRRPG